LTPEKKNSYKEVGAGGWWHYTKGIKRAQLGLYINRYRVAGLHHVASMNTEVHKRTYYTFSLETGLSFCSPTV